MFAARGSEGLESSLHDSLAANVNPRTGGHLAIHGEAESLEAVELRVIVPLTDQVRIGDQNARCFIVRPKFANRFSRLHE